MTYHDLPPHKKIRGNSSTTLNNPTLWQANRHPTKWYN